MFILFYSITSRPSFADVPALFARICELKDTETPLVLLVAMKNDLETSRQVSRQEGRELALRLHTRVFAELVRFFG